MKACTPPSAPTAAVVAEGLVVGSGVIASLSMLLFRPCPLALLTNQGAPCFGDGPFRFGEKVSCAASACMVASMMNVGGKICCPNMDWQSFKLTVDLVAGCPAERSC